MIVWSSLSPKQQIDALARPVMDNSAELAGIVGDIIEQVDTNGDEALKQVNSYRQLNQHCLKAES